MKACDIIIIVLKYIISIINKVRRRLEDGKQQKGLHKLGQIDGDILYIIVSTVYIDFSSTAKIILTRPHVQQLAILLSLY